MTKLASIYEKGHILTEQQVKNLALGYKLHLEEEQEPIFEEGETILFSHRKKPIMAKTPSQNFT
jgi:phosphate starvation-inducible PhoH-like protein